MKALISPNEQRESGYRVAEIHATGFEVAPPLFWVDCADDVAADVYWYDPGTQTCQLLPVPESVNAPGMLTNGEQPTVNGAETL